MAATELKSSLVTDSLRAADQDDTETRGSAFIGVLSDTGPNDENSNFPLKARSLLTIACLVGTDASVELEWHIRKALKDGCTVGEIREVLSLLDVYCDAQTTASVLKTAAEMLDQWTDKPFTV